MKRRTFLAGAGSLACARYATAAASPILTPAPSPKPRINGAKVFGVRPGHPILYTIAVSGVRPMKLSVSGLPGGCSFDSRTGILSGKLSKPGSWRLSIRASNAAGTAERELRLVVGDEIAMTPPMGCNTYGGWGPGVTEANIRNGADAMVRLGLIHHGYSYINIDDGWQGNRGGPLQAIQPNEKFGDMKALCDYVHSLGLKAGIYSTPWSSSYEGFIGGTSDEASGAWTRPNPPRSGTGHFGRHGFETQDAKQWAEWGFDYCKYDWKMDLPERAKRMADALRGCNRDIVLELSNDAPLASAKEFTSIANMCRTTGDIVDVWDRSQLDAEKQKWALGVRDIWNRHKLWAKYNRPGHWNMPCPLRVGVLGGWDLKPLQPTRLTTDEQYSHVSLWCLWSAPLIIGCPVERLDPFTLSLLTNDEVLDIDQDPLGLQAVPLDAEGGEALVKRLENDDFAVGLFNPGERRGSVTLRLASAGLTGAWQVRDLWRQVDVASAREVLSTEVPAHGVALYRLKRK